MKYILLAYCFLFAACKVTAPLQVNTTTIDSTTVTRVNRIDTLWLPGEVVELPPIYIECDSVTNKPKPFTHNVDGTRVDLTSRLNSKGLLTVKCKCDSLATMVTLQDKEIFRLKHEKKLVTLPPVVTHTPHWFDVLFRWWALLTAAYIIWRNRSFILKKFIGG